ncbi:MAG: hypothetical protein IPM35_04715 [Myxococcales bacterium]|nr:hypothetical protein [Myxococcales bacterium]
MTLVGGEGQKMGLLMDTYFRHRNVCWVKLGACKVLLGEGQRYQHTVKLQDPKTLDDLIEQARIDLAKGEYYDVPGRS